MDCIKGMFPNRNKSVKLKHDKTNVNDKKNKKGENSIIISI